MKYSIKYTPFLLVIVLSLVAFILHFNTEELSPYIIVFMVLMLLNFAMSMYFKIKDYFLYGISFVSIVGVVLFFVSDKMSQVYTNNILASMYVGLLLATLVPPLVTKRLFTYEFSEKGYPQTVINSNQFYKINLVLNFIWTAIFIIAIVLSVINYSNSPFINQVLKVVLPIIVMVFVGIPLTKYLPDYLTQVINGKPIMFNTIDELFETMPFGLNKKKAEGLDTIIQFHLSGAEPTIGYLTIKDKVCTYTSGECKNPKTIIRSDSQLWLDISNEKISGDKALLNEMFEIEGDATIMLVFADLFKPNSKQKITKKPPVTYNYRKFAPKSIKNIVVFDGGYRSSKDSKTGFMVNHFVEGAKQAGANIEYFKLKDYELKDCIGCFTCWSKTPGACIFKDDMTMLRQKFRDADLVVFASPLYIYNVSGLLKTFMDRLLPIMKPYMLTNENGDIMHPDRYPEKGAQGYVVFSAGGFPDVAHNFDGLIGMFRAWDSHSENSHLMGEFYLPAAEMIVHPIYKNRKDMIEELCIKAGKQIVEKGYVEKELMEKIQDPMVSTAIFQNQADAFWENLDGKKNYLSSVPKFNLKPAKREEV